MNVSAVQATPRRRLFAAIGITGITGIGYALSWIAGLSVPAPSPNPAAAGAVITNALAGHGTALAVQFALTEGLPAAGLAIVSIALARAARSSGAVATARFAATAGLAAALISLAELAVGITVIRTAAPGMAHVLYDTLNRLDGAKMLALACLGVAGAASVLLPRWLRYAGIAMAIAITAAGIAYLLLLPGMTMLAAPALVLLLIFITGTGLVLGTKGW